MSLLLRFLKYLLPVSAAVGGAVFGSFLNSIEYRLRKGILVADSFRSICPGCRQTIAWYDLVPIFSWFCLSGKCRACQSPISFLYPLIEIAAAFSFGLYFGKVPAAHFFERIMYTIFISALLIISRSDLAIMMIPTYATVHLIPAAWIAAALGFLKINLMQSIVGALSGYVMLWTVSFIYKKWKGQSGIGEGDIDLLSMIGAFLGPFGWWGSLMIGSLSGSVCALYMILTHKADRFSRLPFGPFLSLGALLYLLFARQIVTFLIG